MQIVAYSFERARQFIDAVTGKLAATTWPELSFIVSDRTAQRDFSPEPAGDTELAAPLQPPLSVLSRQLHALAALGGPGTGLVGAGPALGYLHGLGLGNDKDLSECLTACGVSRERVEAVLSALRNGGALAFASEERERRLLAQRGQELTLTLPESAHPASAPIVAPAAFASDQHAEYTPVLMPADVTDRNR